MSALVSVFGRIACLASSGFLVMRLVLNALARQNAARPSALESFPVFHLVATAVLLLIWMLAGSRTLSDRGLRRLDGAGTIAAGLAYALMALAMPLAMRPDQLVLLIMNAVLLGRAALVPSAPRRTAWISAASVAPIPVVTFLLFRTAASRDLLAGAVVTQATLWATFTVVLATLISSVTFTCAARSPARGGSASTHCSRRSEKAGWASSTALSTRCCDVRPPSSSFSRRALVEGEEDGLTGSSRDASDRDLTDCQNFLMGFKGS